MIKMKSLLKNNHHLAIMKVNMKMLEKVIAEIKIQFIIPWINQIMIMWVKIDQI